MATDDAARLPREPPLPEEHGPSMPLLGHLDELRRRLVRIALGLAIAFGLCCWKSDALFTWCAQPYYQVVHEQLSVIAITEAFFIKLRVAFLVALFVSAPWTLWQVWGFVSPGLYPRERRWAVPFVAAGSVFFIGGGAFGYYVGMPAMLKFLLGPTAAGFELDVRAENYIATLSRVLLGLGLVFEAPVVTAFLARFGLVDHRFLMGKSRHAVVIIAVVAAIVTPSGDIPTMVLFMAPMLALYGLSIGVAWALRRRTPRAGEASA